MLSTVVAPEVIVMTTFGANTCDIVGIMMTWFPVPIYIYDEAKLKTRILGGMDFSEKTWK